MFCVFLLRLSDESGHGGRARRASIDLHNLVYAIDRAFKDAAFARASATEITKTIRRLRVLCGPPARAGDAHDDVVGTRVRAAAVLSEAG
jgi:hypothetical protein